MHEQFGVSLSGLPALLLMIIVSVVPVWVAAKWVGARRSGILYALAAVFLGGIAATLVLTLLGPGLLTLILSLVAMVAVYAAVLGTSFPAAIGVAVVAFVIQFILAYVLMALGFHVLGGMVHGPVHLI